MAAEHHAIAKAEWRKKMAALRDQIPPEERAARSASLCRKVEREIFAPMRARLGRPLTVCIYGPFRSEADPLPLARSLLAAGDIVAAPKIRGREMEWRIISGPGDFTPGAWGVPEPDPSRTEPLSPQICPDAVLVPGLAFHPDGSRLGYGGGYYDRMYAAEMARGRRSILWIGFAFARQISDEPLPREPHDLKLDVLATEEKLLWLNKQGACRA